MTRTYRSIWKERHWYKEAPKWFRKKEIKAHRRNEKVYFAKFQETLKRNKNHFW